MVFIIGIGGCTCSGKSSLANKLFCHFDGSLIRVCLISQDDYFKTKEEVGLSTHNEIGCYYNYDHYEALNGKKFVEKVRTHTSLFDLIIVEGNMLTELESVMQLLDIVYFLRMDYDSCRRRRLLRTDYDPPDPVGYFESIVWPAYLAHLSRIADSNNRNISQIDYDNPNIFEIILEEVKMNMCDYVRIQSEAIHIELISDFVIQPETGGSSIFIGTTRQESEGKNVTYLEYEAYHEMAIMEMKKLCKAAREKFSSLVRIVVIHRVGHVPIKEKSVVIATSSPHRVDCIKATEFLIDELKRTVPIWKKEAYEDNSKIWKENTETINTNKRWN